MENDENLVEEASLTESTLLEWKSPEFIVYSRGKRWYILAAIILFAVFAYSTFVRDWFIAFMTVFLGVALILNTRRKAKEVSYRITQLGIYVNDNLHPFSEIHSFWLTLTADQRIVNIVFRKKYLPALPILFFGIDPVTLKNTLLRYIPELEDRTETIAEKLTRILKI